MEDFDVLDNLPITLPKFLESKGVSELEEDGSYEYEKHLRERSAALFMEIFRKRRLWLLYDDFNLEICMDVLYHYFMLFAREDIQKDEDALIIYWSTHEPLFVTRVFEDLIEYKRRLV